MTPQYFKGDAVEIKMDYCGSEAMDLTSAALDDFFEDAFNCGQFLLMLYDEGRVPFSDRIPRDAFISFLIECIANANFIGSYESYIFLINRIFGEGSLIFFEEVTPGVLTMTVSASNATQFDFVALDSSELFSIVTEIGEFIEFSGFPGIESEAELKTLLSEFVPQGIYADITLILFATSLFLVEDGGDFTIVDDLDNDIIFFEL